MKYKMPKIEELFEAGTHYGHLVRRWHPKMAQYIYSAQENIHVINLEKTVEKLETAASFLHGTAKTGGKIIFVGTKRQASTIIENEAKRVGALYVTERWLGGTLTNFKTIKKNVDKLLTLIKKRDGGEFAKYTKKERLLIDREIEKLQKVVGGLVGLEGIPSAVFVIDPRKEKTAVRESLRHNVPVVALIDTNSDPTGIDYVIPGNDDAIKSISLVVRILADAVLEGYAEYAKKQQADKDAKAKKEAADKAEAEKLALRVSGVEITEEIADKEIEKAKKQVEDGPVIKDIAADEKSN